MFEVEDLAFSYPACRLFDGWSASIRAGVTLVRDEAGRGKTTLMRLMAGEIAPQRGRLRIHGIDSRDHPAAYRAQLFWVDPRTEAFDRMTPVDCFASQRAIYPRFDDAALSGLVEGLDLHAHLSKPLFMLSTGSKRKVWLAAAFSSGAALTLLDMPFAALDKPSMGVVLRHLRAAAVDPARALVLADYEAPEDVALSATLQL